MEEELILNESESDSNPEAMGSSNLNGPKKRRKDVKRSTFNGRNNQLHTVPAILPEWLLHPTIIKVDVNSEANSLSELDFLEAFTKTNLERCGIKYLFPVQTEVIPWLMQTTLQRYVIKPPDLCVSAPTGSGKTLTFVIPIVQSLKSRVTSAIRALVVLPVGELAVQVFNVFKDFCKGTDLQVKLVIGQKSFAIEQGALVKETTRGCLSLADIVVATPGRLIDHIYQTRGFTLKNLRFLVIDEADRMIDQIEQGWLKHVENGIFGDQVVADQCCLDDSCQFSRSKPDSSTACAFSKVSEPFQKLLYSATLSQDPEKLHALSLYKPKLFTSAIKGQSDAICSSIKDDFIGKYATPEGLSEQYVVCDTSLKPLVIAYLIKKLVFTKILCFTRSLEHAHTLHLVLNEMSDDPVRELSSSFNAIQRKVILEQFSSGKVRILVCSDLMARGIDIENIDCVISYDMPLYIKGYVHRIGRTARAGRKGIAITLLEINEVGKFRKMLTSCGKELPEKLTVEKECLVPLEEIFKKALQVTSKTIAVEKRKCNFLRKGLKKSKQNRKVVKANLK